jgi:desulfoferrodoxin (superoxide reductase-like protein)
MWESHRIGAISLYDEYGDLIETKFMQQDIDPIVEFDFDDLAEYEIRVQCSLHWIWGKRFIQ